MKRFKFLVSISAVLLITLTAAAQIPVFRDIAGYAGVANDDFGLGAAFIDVNNDGYYDIHLINDSQVHMYDRLYLNQGDLTFRDITYHAGVYDPPFSDCVRIADFDNDGWQDLMITTYNMVEYNRLYHNNGNCTFTDVFQQSGLQNSYYSACDWSDVNQDGLVDLFLLSNYSAPISGLWNNSGFATFNLNFNMEGRFAFGCDAQFCDFDFDGDQDLLVGVYNCERLYENIGGTFQDIAFSAGIMGDMWDFSYPVIGDYDNDGLFDIFMQNAQEYVESPDCLYRQTAPMQFSDVIGTSGIEAMVDAGYGVWGDFDNDGWLDLMFFNYHSSYLWHNNGNGTFTESAAQAGLYQGNQSAQGPVLGDINNDGFLDVYLPCYDAVNKLYVNQGNTNHWLQVTLQGTASNRLGIGARAKAAAGDLVQWRDLGGGKSAHSCNAPFIHFGLAEYTTIDTLIIYWPSGNITTMTGVSTNQRIMVTETTDGELNASGNALQLDDFTLFNCYPNPFNAFLNIKFTLTSPVHVDLSVYNIRGEKAAGLVNAFLQSGEHSAQFTGEKLASGQYFVRLQTDDEVITKKVVLLK